MTETSSFLVRLLAEAWPGLLGSLLGAGIGSFVRLSIEVRAPRLRRLLARDLGTSAAVPDPQLDARLIAAARQARYTWAGAFLPSLILLVGFSAAVLLSATLHLLLPSHPYRSVFAVVGACLLAGSAGMFVQRTERATLLRVLRRQQPPAAV